MSNQTPLTPVRVPWPPSWLADDAGSMIPPDQSSQPPPSGVDDPHDTPAVQPAERKDAELKWIRGRVD